MRKAIVLLSVLFLIAVTAMAQGTPTKSDGHAVGGVPLPKPVQDASNDPLSLGVGGPGSESVDSLAAKIKAKYPQYNDGTDDVTLVSKFVAKYPAYKNVLAPNAPSPQGFVPDAQATPNTGPSAPTPRTTGTRRPPLTLEEVLAMVRSKQSTTAIIERIQRFGGSFGTLSEGDLKAKGVPQVVIFEMREANFLSDLARNSSSDAVDEAGVLTNRGVFAMLDAGLSDDVIVAKIKTSECEFDTSSSALTAMKVRRVPESVILAMVEAPVIPSQSSSGDPTVTDVSPTESLNDYQYLQGFTVCTDFLRENTDFVKAGEAYYNSRRPEDRDSFIAWFSKNQTALLAAEKSCEDDPSVQKDQRASVEAAVLPEISGAYLGQAVSDLQNERYGQLVNRYNQLVVLYNSNLNYIRSVAYRLSIARYFTDMFRQPVPTTINCNTSEDNGFGTTTNCSAW